MCTQLRDRQTEQNVKNDDLLSGISRSKWDEHEHVLLLVRKKKKQTNKRNST